MFALLAGFAAGLLHVFSGPDHLAAVAPLASNRARGQWLTGLQWGIGHTMGVLLIAMLLSAAVASTYNGALMPPPSIRVNPAPLSWNAQAACSGKVK